MRPVAAANRFADRPRFPAPRRSGSTAVTPPIVYRPYRPGDEVSIMKGFNEAFQLARDTTYWRWKFCSHGKPMAMVAVDAKDSVQAQLAGVRVDWMVGGARVPVAQICDLFARRDPRVIRDNVMRRTMEAFYTTYTGSDGITLVFGFPNRTAMKLHGSVRPTFESAQPIRTYRRAVRSRPVSRPDIGIVDRSVPSREALNNLWKRAETRYGHVLPRDADWFFWRFHDRPDVKDYLSFNRVHGDGSLAARLILRREGDLLWICDLVWDGVSKTDLALLEEAVMAEAIRTGARECAIWLQGDNEALGVLLERGWIDRSEEQAIHMVMHVYDSSVDPEEIYAKLYLTLADSDLI